jgi:hypothetical protein
VARAGLRLLSVAPPTVSQVSSSPWSTGSRRNILRQFKIPLSTSSTLWKVLDYTTRGTHLLGS